MNIAQTKAISLIDKHSLPFITESESDYLIARNSAIHEINFEREKAGMFNSEFWNDVHEEILKIDYNKYKQFQK